MCSSGSKSAVAMYMNPPAANGTSAASRPAETPMKYTNSAPIIAVSADRKLKNSAFPRDIPPYTNIPKSPSSCGISWSTTAIVVVIPSGMFVRYAAAIIIPSRKL